MARTRPKDKPSQARTAPPRAEVSPEAAGKAVLFIAPADLRLHDQLSRIPELGAREYEAFRADVEERGISVPLEANEELVLLDGRARLRAAVELGLAAVPVLLVAVADEVEHILRAALLRRELTPSQKAALVVELDAYLELREQGRERSRANLRNSSVEVATLPPRGGKTRDLAGWDFGISSRIVQDAFTVRDADPALLERVKQGELAVHLAARRVRRARRDETVRDPGPIPSGPFDLVLADPPWQLGNPDGQYAPENHYPTMELAEIEALSFETAEDAVLYLWAVNSLLPEALDVMKAWGFEYRTNLVWDKGTFALGAWVRNQHELLLVGRKGSFPPPEPDLRFTSVFQAARGGHSEKPEIVYELLEHAYPHTTRLELFARGKPRAGWSAWGNEVEPPAEGGGSPSNEEEPASPEGEFQSSEGESTGKRASASETGDQSGGRAEP